MRRLLLIVVCCAAAWAGGPMLSPHSVVLAAEFGPQLVQSCWGTATYAADITGYWSAGLDDAKQMEHALPTYLKHTEVHRPFSDYYLQYVGIIAGGKRLVFVSAFTQDPHDDWTRAHWTHLPIIVCGGSTNAWRAAFEPQTKQFSHWNVNGPL